MAFDYYYGQEAEQFSFVRIPQVFFTDKTLSVMSCEAKILYGLMLNRMSLSKKNGWLDKNNRVFIIFTVEDVMETMACAKAKAVRVIKELEDIKLIEKKRQGFGQPTLIYIKNFISKSEIDNDTGLKSEPQEVPKSNFTGFENQTSLGSENELNEVSESNPKKKENISKKDYSNKNNNVHPESARSEKAEQKKKAEELFERLWSLYPSKKGKGKVSEAMKMKLLSIGEEQLVKAIERYKIELEKDASWRKPQNGSTFFNSGYIDYLDSNYVPAVTKQQKQQNKPNGNGFHNFQQRTYDYSKLEEAFIGKANGLL